MHASRKIMLRHFDARAAEYHAEIFTGNGPSETNLDDTDNPVSPSPLFPFPHPSNDTMTEQSTEYRLKSSNGCMRAVFCGSDGHIQRL